MCRTFAENILKKHKVRLLISTRATPFCEKKTVRYSGGAYESQFRRRWRWVSVANNWIRLTFWLDRRYPKSGEVIQPRIRNKNIFSSVARVVRFCHLWWQTGMYNSSYYKWSQLRFNMRSAVSGLGLFAQACPSEYVLKYGNWSNRTPPEIILDPPLIHKKNNVVTHPISHGSGYQGICNYLPLNS